MKKIIIASLVLFALAGLVRAVAVNPVSNVLADSANTALTIIYRDSNGDHSSRDVSVRSIIPSDTTASRNHAVVLTSTTLLTTVTTLGDTFVVVNSMNIPFALCISSGGSTAMNVVLSSVTNRACVTSY